MPVEAVIRYPLDIVLWSYLLYQNKRDLQQYNVRLQCIAIIIEGLIVRALATTWTLTYISLPGSLLSCKWSTLT